MKTITHHAVLFMLLCIGINGLAQIKQDKLNLNLIIQTIDAATKKPVTEVLIEVVRDDSVYVREFNNEKGIFDVSTVSSRFFKPDHDYRVTLSYKIPVSMQSNYFSREYSFKVTTKGLTTNTDINKVCLTKNIDSEVLIPFNKSFGFSGETVQPDPKTSANVDMIKNILDKYPNFEITIAYSKTKDHRDPELEFKRLEYLVDFLTKKGLSIKRITTSIRFVGEALNDDAFEIELSGFNYGR